jgi:putative addiction module component (TIGR02574 family)
MPRLRLRHMSSRARKIIEEALALPKDELVSVVAELQQSVEATDSPAEIEEAWRSEIGRRLRSLKGGSAVTFDGEQVDRELSKLLEE